MRVLGGIVLAAVLGACTSVKMVQRDGCWVKRTEKIFGRVQEQIGPCERPQPQWAQDRLTRVVQECVAQADYRWQGRAIEAFSKGLPYPAQPPPQETARACMEDARTGLVAENDRLKEQLGEMKDRVGEVSTERDALRAEARQDREHLRASHDRIADHLGEAAKKPAGTAHATATSSSDGRATNESGATLATESGSTSAGAPLTASAVTEASPAPVAPLVRARADEDTASPSPAAPATSAAAAPSLVPEGPREAAAVPPTAKKSKPVAARARPTKGPTRGTKAPICEPSPACAVPATSAEAGAPAQTPP